MSERITYEEIGSKHLNELARLFVESFNSEPWNDEWTIDTATERLRQMINAEGFYGLCAYRGSCLCGAVIGSSELFYNGMIFHIKEFWVKNDRRGTGTGTQIFIEFERRLRAMDICEVFLLTSKGRYTEHFYHKQDFETDEATICMRKRL